VLVKRNWAEAFEQSISFNVPSQETMIFRMLSPPHRSVARALCFTDAGSSVSQEDNLLPPTFAASPVTQGKKRRGCAKKKATPTVETSVRSCTRSMVKNDGYHPKPVVEVQEQPKKRAKVQPREVYSAKKSST